MPKLPDASVQSRSIKKDSKEVKKTNYTLLYVSIFILLLIEVFSNFLDTSSEKYSLFYYPLFSNLMILISFINIVHYVVKDLIVKVILGILIGLYIFQIYSMIFTIGLTGYEIGTNAIALGSFMSLGLLIWMEEKL